MLPANAAFLPRAKKPVVAHDCAPGVAVATIRPFAASMPNPVDSFHDAAMQCNLPCVITPVADWITPAVSSLTKKMLPSVSTRSCWLRVDDAPDPNDDCDSVVTELKAGTTNTDNDVNVALLFTFDAPDDPKYISDVVPPRLIPTPPIPLTLSAEPSYVIAWNRAISCATLGRYSKFGRAIFHAVRTACCGCRVHGRRMMMVIPRAC